MSTFYGRLAVITQNAQRKGTKMLRGFATVNFFADDLIAARDWYASLFGIDAYFQRPDEENPAYIEFRVGDYEDELGIIDRRYAPHDQSSPGGAVVYWHVDDVAAAVKDLQARGAKELEPIVEREAGFITASMVDPFGNILGVMYNPHYVEILAAR
jgi:predicted enzyme related to lactoylglutathione lyase